MSDDSSPPASGARTRGGDSVFKQFAPVAIGLVLLSLLLFAGTLGNAFVLDDTRLIRDNPRLADPSRIVELLTSPDSMEEINRLLKGLKKEFPLEILS